MGGNALASYGARRFSAEEYRRLLREVLILLDKFEPVGIPYYKNKLSFGDMDLIVRSLQSHEYEEILCLLGSNTYLRNGEVMSVLYREMQIDIIPMKPEEVSTSLVYYSYNDLGNLMGKIFHKFGVKYGHRGLTLPVKDGDYGLGEVVLSREAKKIFEFGGFDHQRYLCGFNDLEEIFKYVIGSTYFNADIFKYEALNHVNRRRDSKRQTYHSFLEYLANTKDSDGYSIAEGYSTVNRGYKFFSDKAFYLPKIFHAFPEAKAEHDALLEQRKLRQAIKEKFNGNMVMEVTGLEGNSLGKFMAFLKECWGGFGPELLEKDENWIKGQIFDIYKEWSV